MKIIINSIGLIIDIIGAFLLFFFGLPTKNDSKGHIHVIAEQVNIDETRIGKQFNFWARFAFALLMLGFILQLISNFLIK